MIERKDVVVKNKLGILSVIVIILLVVYMYYGIDSAEENTGEENYKVLSDAIIRSAVQCYAIEGFYPPDIEYLEDNYGLMVDRDKYFISYSVFASNIMPQITVFLK